MAGGNKICLGCGVIGKHGRSGRCEPCSAGVKAKYREPEYITERDHARLMIEAGASFDCPRCGEPIELGDEWDMGHQGDGTLRPEHARCNRGARSPKVYVIV